MLTRPCPWTGCKAVNEFDAVACFTCGRTLGPGVIDDRYQVEKRTGSTGWGTWYLARDLDTSRQVSVKILDARFDPDREVKQAVIDEAFALVRIRHGNVLGVERVIVREDYAGVVMEPFVGETLDAILKKRRNKILIEEALDLYCMVVEGVKAAHEAGLMHRDIKASNVLVDSSGIAKLVDFGLACKDKSGARWRQPGQGFYGTLTYLAPELFSDGDWSKPQGDIYALGILLFKMLTGSVPFALPRGISEDERLAGFAKLHALQPIPAMRTLRGGIPDALDRVVLRACAKTPEARHPSCQALLDDVAAARSSLRDVEILRVATQGERAPAEASAELRALCADLDRFEQAAEALASLYDSLDDHASWVALQMKRLGLATRPDHKARLQRALARVLDEKLHLTGRAQRVLEESLLVDLTDPDVLVALERTAIRNRSWGEAAKALAKALEQHRDLPAALGCSHHKRLARWLAEFVADRAGAEAALKKALTLVADDDEALRALEGLFRLSSRDRDLVEVIHRRAATTRDPDWRRELYKEAWGIAMRIGETARAEQLLRELATSAPEDPWAAQELARLAYNPRPSQKPAAPVAEELDAQLARARQLLEARMPQLLSELEAAVPNPIARQRALEEYLRPRPGDRITRPPLPAPPVRKATTVPPPPPPPRAEARSVPDDEVTMRRPFPSVTEMQVGASPPLEGPSTLPSPESPLEQHDVHTSMSSCRAMIRDCITYLQTQATQVTDPINQRAILRESAVVALAVGDRRVAEQLLREIIRVDDTCLWAFDELIAQRQAQGDRLEAQVLIKRRNDLGRARGFILATRQHNPTQLVSDKSSVYWIQTTGQSEAEAISEFSVMQVRKDGYGLSFLVENLIGSPHVSLAVDDAAVYANAGFGSLTRVTKAGARMQELGRSSKKGDDGETVFSWDELSIAVDETSAFWTDHEGNLTVASKSGEGSPVVLPGRRRRFHGVMVDEQNVYWVESGRREALTMKSTAKQLLLTRISPPAKRTSVAADDMHRFAQGINVRLIGQDAGHVYCASDLIVMAVDKSNGTLTEVARHGAKITCGAVQSGKVYWGDEAGAISASDLEGKEVVVLCSGQHDPCAIAVDDHHVYWANRGDGTIRHVAK
ncbi:MAG: protein kinase [Deltaproteobacteria bacterium]|nr:protein kinase [Deltaproteobacteria bacterium]